MERSRNMEETSLHFYHSKIKLILQIIIFFPFMAGGYYMAYMGVVEQSFLIILMALFFAILFSCFWGAAILKIFRNQPYITITNTYIQLDPQTKSEVTIYYDHIESIQVSEASFQKLIEIVIYDEDGLFDQLSLHNKIRLGPNGLFGFKTFTIAYNAIRKRERPQLLATLDNIMAYKKGQTMEDFTITDTSNKPLDSQQDFMEKYDPEPSVNLIIDNAYLKKAYEYSVFLFLFMFVLFYLLLDSGNGYLFYIIISFFAFPFAKILIDWMGAYKLRQRLEKQKGFTYYFDQIKYFFDAILFHASIFIAPFGLLFLLIRYIVRKAK